MFNAIVLNVLLDPCAAYAVYSVPGPWGCGVRSPSGMRRAYFSLGVKEDAL